MKTLSATIVLAGLVSAASADDAALQAMRHQVLQGLRAMQHGYYPASAWQKKFDLINDYAEAARKGDRLEALVDARLIEAMVYTDMLHQHEKAAGVLRKTLDNHGHTRAGNMNQVYSRMADVYASLGNEPAIRLLIEEFKTSPHFDPESYEFSGGRGPNDPIRLVRPKARGRDSITVTAMGRALDRAAFGTGKAFPDFEAETADGRFARLDNYRGKIVLIDFWQKDWVPWQRGLSQLIRTYQTFHDVGFEIIGVNLDRDAAGAMEYAGQHHIPWLQVVGNRKLPALVGVFGESSNFLVDHNGVILGRNLRGSDLAEALRNVLQN